jgi:hypothetical protein
VITQAAEAAAEGTATTGREGEKMLTVWLPTASYEALQDASIRKTRSEGSRVSMSGLTREALALVYGIDGRETGIANALRIALDTLGHAKRTGSVKAERRDAAIEALTEALEAVDRA